jgi:hypothetical protein
MAENQVTDGDSSVEPQTSPASGEPHADSPDNTAAKDQVDQKVDQDVTADAPTKTTTDSPRKSDTKADSKRSKGKDEPQSVRAQNAADVSASDTKAPDDQRPASVAPEPQPSKPKSLADVMKVDLRVRRRRRF